MDDELDGIIAKATDPGMHLVIRKGSRIALVEADGTVIKTHVILEDVALDLDHSDGPPSWLRAAQVR